jgi:mono/diheme cytochrome c family protein
MIEARRLNAALRCFLLCLAPLAAACPAPQGALGYLDDPAFARAQLIAALVNPANGYSALRLNHYATGGDGDWERLPEWNPPSEIIEALELDAPEGASSSRWSGRQTPLAFPRVVGSDDDPALVALGEAAFARYPVQVVAGLKVALTSRAAAERYGLWVDEARGVGGLVRARMADGSVAVAMTCATCHARAEHGGWSPGLPNARLDLGAAMLDAERVARSSGDPLANWGPGRVDVTTAEGLEPARIPDLRPARWLTWLHQDATLNASSLTVLALRIETLIVTSNAQALRPPRMVALALAAYLRSLGAGLPQLDAPRAASADGAALFAERCERCHGGDGLTGQPIALEEIGTDPILGRSAERGTGYYRVPSLRGVGTRGPLLHDGTLPSLESFLDPGRLDPAFGARLHGDGAVGGHTYGLDLEEGQRRALLTYLHAL